MPVSPEDEGYGGSARGIAFERFVDGGAELLGSIVFEQSEQLCALAGGRFAACKGSIQQGFAFWNSISKPAAQGGAQSFPFFLKQGFLVGRIQDQLMAIITTAMPRDFIAAVENAHGYFRGYENERTADGAGWNGVVVEIETDVDGLARLHGQDEIGFEPMRRQRQKAGFFLLKDLLNASRVITRPGAAMSDFVAPSESLAVEVFERGKEARREKRVAHVSDGSLDAALLVARAHLTRTRGKVVMGTKFEQSRMEVDLVAPTFQYGAAKIVVQNDPGQAAPVFESSYVTA
jgi:hypothetical protein